jgi:hypothetical protein
MFKSILTVLSLSAIAVSQPVFSFDADLGYVPNNASIVYKNPFENHYSTYERVFLLTLHPSLEWKFVYGNLTISSFSAPPKKGMSFTPFRVVWGNEFGLFYQFKQFRISAGWDHNCAHKVMVTSFSDKQGQLVDNAYDKIYLRFSYSNQR